MIRQPIHDELLKRLKEKRRLMQGVAGPRQVGKTTVVRQAVAASRIPSHYASADEPTLRDRAWIEQQWDIARLKAREGRIGAILVLDEIQKVSNWSSAVKWLWDADTHAGIALKVVLLGSSPLLIQKGLTESLAGRFEMIATPHWSFSEMKQAFGWNLEQYIFYGAYPGAAELIDDPQRWRRYILDSLMETTLSRDILLLTRVDKPALLRRLFQPAVPTPARSSPIKRCSASLSMRETRPRWLIILSCFKGRECWPASPNTTAVFNAAAPQAPNSRC
jgi:hypothetical protein